MKQQQDEILLYRIARYLMLHGSFTGELPDEVFAEIDERRVD
jgi:hypothetical protein